MKAKRDLTISDQWLRAILGVLYEKRTTTRGEIVEATGLNVASVSQTLQFLIRRGIVQCQGALRSSLGRKRELLKLNSEVGYFVAVDLEGTRVRFGLTNFVGDVRYRWEEPLIAGQKLEIGVLAKGVRQTVESLDPADRARVLAMGVSCTGAMGRDGRVRAVNLGWEDFPLVEQMTELSPVPVFFGNDCLTKLMAERWLGVAQGSQDCLYVTVAQGIGMANLVNGQPLRGTDSLAGELGHITIDTAAADACACGKTGCLEAIVSSPSIVRQYWEKIGHVSGPMRGEMVVEVFEKARLGDSIALQVIDRAAAALGLALSHTINIFNPALVILGGDLIHAEDLFLPRIHAELTRHVLPKTLACAQVRFSSLGYDIGIVGAASMAFHEALEDRVLLRKMCGPISLEISKPAPIKRKSPPSSRRRARGRVAGV